MWRCFINQHLFFCFVSRLCWYIECWPQERRRTAAKLGAPPPCGPLRSPRNPKKLWSRWLRRRVGTKARNRVARRIKIPKRRVSAVGGGCSILNCRCDNNSSPDLVFRPFPAPAAEPVKADQAKTSSSAQKMVENGNQGLTTDEIIQKKREEFFRKRMVVPTEKPM